MSKREVTVDLSIERGYSVAIPVWYKVQIGKVHGIGKRGNQEDAFAISEIKEETLKETGILVILADGMGGMQDGEKASTAAVISCLKFFEHSDFSEEWMREMVLDANEDVLDALGDAAGTGGSTLIAVHIDGNVIRWISVGDSHLYLYRDGELFQLNQDHNYASVLQKKVEENEITEEEALNDSQRKALTSFLGLVDLDEIDESDGLKSMESGDRLLLMSDGIFGTLSEEAIIAAMEFPVGKAAMRLQMEIEKTQKTNQDNYTGILIHFD